MYIEITKDEILEQLYPYAPKNILLFQVKKNNQYIGALSVNINNEKHSFIPNEAMSQNECKSIMNEVWKFLDQLYTKQNSYKQN